MTSLTHPPPSSEGWVKLVEAPQQEGLALQGKHRLSDSKGHDSSHPNAALASNNQAALRENDNLPVASSAESPTSRTTGTTSAKNNCITKCL